MNTLWRPLFAFMIFGQLAPVHPMSFIVVCLVVAYCIQHADVHDDFAFLLFGTCRRRVRASLLRFLRFSSREPPDLSSVMDIQDLQLNPSPRRRLPTRLLVEPLALRLARLREALEECNCRYFESEFLPDPLAGSGCALVHRQHASLVVYVICVHPGNFVHEGESCNGCAVMCCTI